MSNLPVDRDKEYMKSMWGTTKLVTDYDGIQSLEAPPITISGSEFTHGHGFFYGRTLKHDLKKQTEIHESIRNDDDYDDWEYGTEPSYGKSQ
jgi:hypothetical protein